MAKMATPVETYDFYISGPMTGLPDWNFPAFKKMANELENRGKTYFSPADLEGGDTSHPRDVYMRQDIEGLLKCKAVILLAGWKKSKGALLEVAIAKELNLPIFTEDFQLLKEESVCQEADYLVSEDRGSDYGHPYYDFRRTGRLWAPVLEEWARTTKGEEPVPPRLVGLCMVQVKVSREVHKPKRDNRVDGPGYFKCVDMIENFVPPKTNQ